MNSRLPKCLLHIVAQYIVAKPTRFKSFIDPKKIDWYRLSGNPAAISLLEKNIEKISWIWLSKNPNPAAISLLEKKPTWMDWWVVAVVDKDRGN